LTTGSHPFSFGRDVRDVMLFSLQKDVTLSDGFVGGQYLSLHYTCTAI